VALLSRVLGEASNRKQFAVANLRTMREQFKRQLFPGEITKYFQLAIRKKFCAEITRLHNSYFVRK